MLVKMIVGLSGPTILLKPGDECDMPRDEALRLVRAGFAVAVGHEVETTQAAPIVEKRPGRKRRG